MGNDKYGFFPLANEPRAFVSNLDFLNNTKSWIPIFLSWYKISENLLKNHNF